MKILCSVAPWNEQVFRVIATEICAESEVAITSNFLHLDQQELIARYQKKVDQTRHVRLHADAVDVDVIARCRLLRILPLEEALLHVAAMRAAIRSVLENCRPDVVLSETTDQFYHDLLFRECNAMGIRVYAPLKTFVNGYLRLSSRGEYCEVRKPGMEEIERLRKLILQTTYKPDFVVPRDSDTRRVYLKTWLGNLLRVMCFTVKRRISKDKYNYHYWASSQSLAAYNAHLIPRFEFGDEAWCSRIKSSTKPILFIPLQCFPEATVDYWCDDLAMADYPNALFSLVAVLSQRFQILFKEHPNVWGLRKPGFYRDLMRSGVDLVAAPSCVPAQQCIDLADAVLVWTGSTGFEAAIRGKPVLTTCWPYYATGHRFKKISLETAIDDIVDFVASTNSAGISLEEQNQMLEHLLAGMFPGDFKNDGKFDPTCDRQLQQAKQLGKSIKSIYESQVTMA